MPISVIQRTRAIGFRSIVRAGEASIFRDSAWAASTVSHCVEAVPGTPQFLFQLSNSLKDMRPHSRGAMRPRFGRTFVPLITEGAGNAGCLLHPQPRVRN